MPRPLRNVIYEKPFASEGGGATFGSWHGWDDIGQATYSANRTLGPGHSAFYTPRSPASAFGDIGVTQMGRGSSATPIKNALRNARTPMANAKFGRSGLLMTAIGAGTAGAVMGDGDFTSFAMGAGAGLVGGHVAEVGAAAVYKGLTSYARKNSAQMSLGAFKAVSMGRALTSAGSRGMLFGAGALLAGGMFSSMFASNSTSYKRGFNAQRGNSIVR